jgi:adenylate cyclase class IV
MHSYEIEIKSLLGSSEVADALRLKMKELDTGCALKGTNKQLNHYFTAGDITHLYESVADFFSMDEQTRLKKITEDGSSFSVRTRKMDDLVLLVVKASIDNTTSENGIARIEFESPVAGHSIEELDQRLLDAGYTYQAKWSRDREEYLLRGVNVTIDRNAGYGYLAEFEKVVDDSAYVEVLQEELRALMAELGVAELPQDRLERMFAYYNTHWPEYYGTEKIFIIE